MGRVGRLAALKATRFFAVQALAIAVASSAVGGPDLPDQDELGRQIHVEEEAWALGGADSVLFVKIKLRNSATVRRSGSVVLSSVLQGRIEAMVAAEVTEPSALIRIAKLYAPSTSPVEVYEVGTWLPAGTTPYATRPIPQVQAPGRWAFCGRLASNELRARYNGTSVRHYFGRGSANPVVYVNA